RGGERDDSTHAGPADDKDCLGTGSGHMLVKEPSANEGREGGSGEDPEQAQNDEEEREEQAVDCEPAGAVAFDTGKDVRQLQADEEKDQAIEDEIERVPGGVDLDARGRGEIGCAAAAEEEAAGDDADDARGVDLLGGEVGDVGNDERDDHLERAVLDEALTEINDVTEDDAETDAAGDEPEKIQQ